MKLFFSLLLLVACGCHIAGIFMCGVNVIQFLFGVGGSYSTAIAGFIMTIVSSYVVAISKGFLDSDG